MSEEHAMIPAASAITRSPDGGEPKRHEFLNEFDVGSLLETAGQIELSKEQEKALWAEVPETEIEIRPDGLVYLPWNFYANRMTAAFSLGWALIPQGMPKLKGDYMLWGHWLIIGGKLVGFALGEQQYQAKNQRMTYGDATEGCASNALMRLCGKRVGIGRELWTPSFVEAWKAKHAETYSEGGRVRWRKKGRQAASQPAEAEPQSQPPVATQAAASQSARPYTADQAAALRELYRVGKMVWPQHKENQSAMDEIIMRFFYDTGGSQAIRRVAALNAQMIHSLAESIQKTYEEGQRNIDAPADSPDPEDGEDPFAQ